MTTSSSAAATAPSSATTPTIAAPPASTAAAVTPIPSSTSPDNLPTKNEASENISVVDQLKEELADIIFLCAKINRLKSCPDVRLNHYMIDSQLKVLHSFSEKLANFLRVSLSDIVLTKNQIAWLDQLEHELLDQKKDDKEKFVKREKKVNSYLNDFFKQASKKFEALSLDRDFPNELKPFLESARTEWSKKFDVNGIPHAQNSPLDLFDSLAKLERFLYLLDMLELITILSKDPIKPILEQAFERTKASYIHAKKIAGFETSDIAYNPRLQTEIDTLKMNISAGEISHKDQLNIVCEIIDELIPLEYQFSQTQDLKSCLEWIKDAYGLIPSPQSIAALQKSAPTPTPLTTAIPSSTAAFMNPSITTVNLAEETKTTNQNNFIELDAVLANSNEFFDKFKDKKLPTENRLRTLLENGKLTREAAEKQIASVRIILSAELKSVLTHFLTNKKTHGSSIEKKFYETMTEEQLILRFFQKRAIVFTNLAGMDDYYLLNDMRKGCNDQAFEKVGTENEGNLNLHDCLSYDEMKLSALVGLSGLTSFINNGSRNNNGEPHESGSFEKEGVFIALTGPRFEKEGFMDYQDIFVTRDQNKPENGYGQDLNSPANKNINEEKAKALEPFAKLYQQINDRFPTYEEVEKKYDHAQENKTPCDYLFSGGKFINKAIYKKRIHLSLVPLLEEAIYQSKIHEDKPIFLSVPGLGLSPAWSANLFDELGALQLEVYHELLRDPRYSKIKVVDFNYFPENTNCLETFDRLFENNPDQLPQTFSYTYGSRKEGTFKQYAHGKNSILREGSSKVDDQYLLIRVLPWDSNAAIGNEYFMGRLNASGDPACACSATILEVFNAFINPGFVNTANLNYCGNPSAINAAEPVIVDVKTPAVYTTSEGSKNNYIPTHFKPAAATEEKVESQAAPSPNKT